MAFFACLLCLMLWQAYTSSSTTLGDNISKLIVKRLKGLDRLKEHPGHAFGLGCDSWSASRYQGGVRGWSAPGRVRWLAMSYMQAQEEEETKTITTDARAASDLKAAEAAAAAAASTSSSPSPARSSSSSSSLKSLLDVSGFVLPELDVPHLRLSLSQARIGSCYELFLDYIPRQDFLAATPASSPYLAYYDKYYQGLDEFAFQTVKEAEEQGLALLPLPPASSTLTRITTSALALHVQIPPTAIASGVADEFITRLCEGHMNRWLAWLDAAAATAASSPSSPTSQTPPSPHAPSVEAASALAREYNLYKLMGEERKYHYAMIFGADCAPKAEEISATIIGPP